MEEKRWILVQNQTSRNRKFVCILNDVERTRFEEYEQVLNREKTDICFRMTQDIHPVKLLLAQRRSLQKCLALKQKTDARAEDKMFGRYAGVSLDDMRQDIDKYISTNQPRLRRLRHVHRLLNRGKTSGKLLDNESTKSKMDEMFQKFITERETLMQEWRQKHFASDPWRRFAIKRQSLPNPQKQMSFLPSIGRNK